MTPAVCGALALAALGAGFGLVQWLYTRRLLARLDRMLVKGGGVSLNKEKLAAFDRPVTADDLIDGKYLLVQRGKKNYYLLTMK